jgi:hypothetical protein
MKGVSSRLLRILGFLLLLGAASSAQPRSHGQGATYELTAQHLSLGVADAESGWEYDKRCYGTFPDYWCGPAPGYVCKIIYDSNGHPSVCIQGGPAVRLR